MALNSFLLEATTSSEVLNKTGLTFDSELSWLKYFNIVFFNTTSFSGYSTYFNLDNNDTLIKTIRSLTTYSIISHPERQNFSFIILCFTKLCVESCVLLIRILLLYCVYSQVIFQHIYVLYVHIIIIPCFYWRGQKSRIIILPYLWKLFRIFRKFTNLFLIFLRPHIFMLRWHHSYSLPRVT